MKYLDLSVGSGDEVSKGQRVTVRPTSIPLTYLALHVQAPREHLGAQSSSHCLQDSIGTNFSYAACRCILIASTRASMWCPADKHVFLEATGLSQR